MSRDRLVWFRELDTPDDELVQETAFFADQEGYIKMSVASFETLMGKLGYERILDR